MVRLCVVFVSLCIGEPIDNKRHPQNAHKEYVARRLQLHVYTYIYHMDIDICIYIFISLCIHGFGLYI